MRRARAATASAGSPSSHAKVGVYFAFGDLCRGPAAGVRDRLQVHGGWPGARAPPSRLRASRTAPPDPPPGASRPAAHPGRAGRGRPPGERPGHAGRSAPHPRCGTPRTGSRTVPPAPPPPGPSGRAPRSSRRVPRFVTRKDLRARNSGGGPEPPFEPRGGPAPRGPTRSRAKGQPRGPLGGLRVRNPVHRVAFEWRRGSLLSTIN